MFIAWFALFVPGSTPKETAYFLNLTVKDGRYLYRRISDEIRSGAML